MKDSIQERARFDLIRYANCWEDADVLLKALDVKEGGRYLSIASSGDNTFSILSQNPSFVLAVDINPTQLACAELRKVVFLNLSYEETLLFLGVQDGQDRISTYRWIRNHLSTETQQFWDEHQEGIRQGILHMGKFENYFRLFRRWVLPLLQPRATTMELLRTNGEGHRPRVDHRAWETWRWRLFFRIFFSRPVLGRLGRDPAFFRYVEDGVSNRILERVKQAFTVLPGNGNPYLEYILTGRFKNTLPHYLRKENFDAIRRNLDKLSFFKGDVQAAFQAHGTLKFNGFNLSDIFEYMSPEQYAAELERIVSASRKGARLVYWNMLVERRCPQALKERLRPLEILARDLFLKDKAFFYTSFIVEEVL